MKVFVSYVRHENGPDRLAEIERVLAGLGEIYIDDLHGIDASDRHAMVTGVLDGSSVLVAVASPSYLATPWTRFEYEFALRQGKPILALLDGDKIISKGDPLWPWPDA